MPFTLHCTARRKLLDSAGDRVGQDRRVLLISRERLLFVRMAGLNTILWVLRETSQTSSPLLPHLPSFLSPHTFDSETRAVAL